MITRRVLKTACILSGASMLALNAGAASAEPQPVSNPNGTISGTVDGHAFELQVHCKSSAGALLISSHDQSIHHAKTIGGVEPAVSIIAPGKGFQFVGFVGGNRYKFIRGQDSIEAFPFTLARKVRAKKHGKIEADFTLDCPTL